MSANSPNGRLEIQSVVDHVYTALRERILSGDLPRASKLRQVSLAEEMGVSRTPLREALRRLAGNDSLAALDRAEAALRDEVPHEMLLLDLYNALRALDSLTGATTTDDILNLIFSSFCIGK